MGDRPAIGGHLQLSGTPTRTSIPKYFRPKRLGELVFPGIGMIMQPLYWTKFTFHLEDQGFDPTRQEHLFLWAQEGEDRVPTESVLYYSILSTYDHGGTSDDVSVGIQLANGWLFKSDFYNRIVDGLLTRVTEPDSFRTDEFCEDVFHADFKTDCERYDVPLTALMDEELQSAGGGLSDHAGRDAQFEAVTKAFTTAVKRCFDHSDGLHRGGGKDETAIGATKAFATDLIPHMSEAELDLFSRRVRDFRFRRKEAETLLEVIDRSNKGEFLIPSMELVAYADPLANQQLNREAMRAVLEDVFEAPDQIIETIKSQFGEVDAERRSPAALQRVAFYWSLNYFLADGESIARSLIDEDEPLQREEISRAIQGDEETAEWFRLFFERLVTRQAWQDHLVTAIDTAAVNDDELAEYLNTLLDCSRQGVTPTVCFIKLLEKQGTIDERIGDQYPIRGEATDSNTAGFYGVRELINWTRTLMVGMND